MSRNNSEIFDSFAKIAQEQGLISKDSKNVKTAQRRADGLTPSDLEVLYGVKPETIQEMEYERNIVEVAHPNSAVVAPAYDRINGLVENVNERQNIIIHILEKPVNGYGTLHRYAQKEFISSLVSLANHLDNVDNEELRSLADVCLMQLCSKKKIVKEAVPVVPIVLGVVALFGAIYAHQHLENFSEGLRQDYERLKETLKTFSETTSYGVGHDYDQSLKDDVKGLQDRLEQFWQAYEGIADVLRDLETPRDADDIKKMLQETKNTDVLNAYKRLTDLITNFSTYIAAMEKNFNSKAYQAKHTQNTGMISSLLEKVHLVGGKDSLFANDFAKVLNALGPFKASVAELLASLKESKSKLDKLKSDLSNAQKTQAEFGVSDPAAKPASEDIKSNQEQLGKAFSFGT